MFQKKNPSNHGNQNGNRTKHHQHNMVGPIGPFSNNAPKSSFRIRDDRLNHISEVIFKGFFFQSLENYQKYSKIRKFKKIRKFSRFPENFPKKNYEKFKQTTQTFNKKNRIKKITNIIIFLFIIIFFLYEKFIIR